MTNRITTLLEYGGAEWRNDLKLAVLTIICCAGIILFFSADDLLGAVLLRVIYFRYGTLIATSLILWIWIIILKWATIPIEWKVIGTGFFIIIAGVILISDKLVLFISLLSGFILGVGLACFIPAAIASWLIFAIGSVIRGHFREYLTEPLLTRMIMICCLFFTACFVSVRFVQSQDFTIIDYQALNSENYYTVSFTSMSSDVSGGTAYYKCNTISVSCTEISASEQLKETH